MFYTSGISLAFFLAFVLFSKRDQTKADRILAAWLLIIGVHLSGFYLSLSVDPYFYPYLVVFFSFPLLHGPMLYFYTASLTSQHLFRKQIWVWHFVPALLICLMCIPFFLLPYNEKLQVFGGRGKDFEIETTVQRIFVSASGVVYVTLSLWLLKTHSKRIQDRFSYVEKINLRWLRYLIYGVGIVWLAVFFGDDFIVFSLVALFVMLLGYFGIKQMGIFTQTNLASQNESLPIQDILLDTSLRVSEPISAAGEQKGKYQKSSLAHAASLEIHQQLCRVMSEQKPFLNPELTIGELATTFGVHSNVLSQVINSMESKTFYDFINGKRVEEFKRIVALPQNQRYTLLALAYDCGFNSKTAFYRNFKNVTGQSPTQYLKQHHIQIHSY